MYLFAKAKKVSLLPFTWSLCMFVALCIDLDWPDALLNWWRPSMLDVQQQASLLSQQNFCRGSSCGSQLHSLPWECSLLGTEIVELVPILSIYQAPPLGYRSAANTALPFQWGTCCPWCVRSECHHSPCLKLSRLRALSVGHVLNSFADVKLYLLLFYCHL